MQIIPFDKRDSGLIWFNGKLIPWQTATIHILNHGLHYATSVFEGERSYNGKIFASKKHSERLIKSASILGMYVPYSVEQLDQAKSDLIKEQGLTDAYIRPIVWSGSEKMTISAIGNSVNVAIAAWEWPNFYKDKSEGIRLTISDWVRPHPKSAPVEAKAAGLYMTSSMSQNAAKRLGYDDALMLDYRGFIAEATAANFFIVKNSELHTPIADCFLNGITRQTVIELAKIRDIKIVERYIKPEELVNADEIFVTGSAAEITPVIQVADNNYQLGKITKLLINDYYNLTHK